MSKELEAFKDLTDKYILEDSLGGYETIEQRYSEVCAVIMEALTELEELKRYPTSEEVCKALSEYFREEVIFLVNDKEFVIKCNIGYKYIVETDDVLYYIKVGLPLYLITLIGRFYEGDRK